MPKSMRHPECGDCALFKAHRPAWQCVKCGAGEFFEPKLDDLQPGNNELMAIYAKMECDDD